MDAFNDAAENCELRKRRRREIYDKVKESRNSRRRQSYARSRGVRDARRELHARTPSISSTHNRHLRRKTIVEGIRREFTSDASSRKSFDVLNQYKVW